MASRFVFKMKFDNEGTEDFTNVDCEQISRILDAIVAGDGEGETGGNLLMNISATRFHSEGGTPNAVIKTMLCFLVMDPERRSVSYCFNCDKYVIGRINETICAYDTVGHQDSHRTFKIDIIETPVPSIEAICHDAIRDLSEEIKAIREGLICSREFLNKIVDIACSAHTEAEGSTCGQHHACGTEPGDHNCSCIRV